MIKLRKIKFKGGCDHSQYAMVQESFFCRKIIKVNFTKIELGWVQLFVDLLLNVPYISLNFLNQF